MSRQNKTKRNQIKQNGSFTPFDLLLPVWS